MSEILEQKISKHISKLFHSDLKPVKLVFKYNAPTLIELSNGKSNNACCINCQNPKCLKYTDMELNVSNFKDFPCDKKNHVCPSGALTWEEDEKSLKVKKELCIKCGICASRCPFGAIYLDETCAVINNENNDLFKNVKSSDVIDEKNFSVFSSVTKEGLLNIESDDDFKYIYNKILCLTKLDVQFPNILSRNLLLALNVNCGIRRRGDVYLRMDSIINIKPYDIGVVEIEFSNEVLNSPRNILDNVAVLSSRYGFKSENIYPLIISLSLPNKRTDYWRVLKDIKNVLNIEINTVTIASLMLLVWNLKSLNTSFIDFYTDVDTCSIRKKLESILNRNISTNMEVLPIFECTK